MEFEIVVTVESCHPEFGRETPRHYRFTMPHWGFAINKYEDLQEKFKGSYAHVKIELVEVGSLDK